MKTKKRTPQLPKKMSALLRVAVRDAQALEKSKKYKLAMGDWHVPADESVSGKCEVCLAGSVMARTLGCNPSENMDPHELRPRLADALLAINCMREGDFFSAAAQLGLSDKQRRHRALQAASVLVDFGNGKNYMAPSWQHYLDAADLLERFGL